MGLLEFSSKVITVAGTNGKGSCVIFLESILLAAGYLTGVYISPHLLIYNERIRLQGEEIDDKRLVAALALVKNACGKLVLTYFEFTTLAALTIFKSQPLDFLILEVGLGGRFDAVNILESDIAIVTSIALDHTEILGMTREEIGYEKSGIMRFGKVVICGENMPASVYLAADSLQVKLYVLNRDFFYLEENDHWHWLSPAVAMKNLPLLQLPVNSAALAVMAVRLLAGGFKILPAAVTVGLKNAFLPGRWQKVIFANKEIILDVAHNPESASLLAANLVKSSSRGRTLAVVSMLRDKDILNTLRQLGKLIDRWYLGLTDNVRVAAILRLIKCLRELEITNFIALPTVAASLQLAIAECHEKDRIVVFGSFSAVADGLKVITR